MPHLPTSTAERSKARSLRLAILTLALGGVAWWFAASWLRRDVMGGADALQLSPSGTSASIPSALDRIEDVAARQSAVAPPAVVLPTSPVPEATSVLSSTGLDAEVVFILPTGDPFPGLGVRAHRASDGWRWDGRSDGSGRCLLPAARTPDKAPVELRVTGENAWPCVWTLPLESVVVHQVPRKGEILVEVVDPSGRAIGGAFVRMIPAQSSLRESRPMAVRCDANGLVRLDAVVDADTTLQATAPGFVGKCVRLASPFDGVSTAPYRLELARAAQHRVVFVNASGVPAAGLAVRCPSGTIPVTTTDDDGGVDVPAGTANVTLHIEPPGDPYRVPFTLELLRTSSRAVTRVVLPEPARLRFAFVGEDVPYAEALTVRVRDGAIMERWKGCIDPAEGELKLLMEVWQRSSPLLPGLVELEAPVPWSDVDAVELYRSGRSVRIEASGFEMRDGVPTTALPASAGVVGRVVPGATVPGDWVLLVEGPRGYLQRCDLNISVAGDFRCERLPAGPLTVSFIPTRHLASPPGLPVGVVVFRGELTEGEVLDLGELDDPELGDLVTIRVVEPGGAPAYGALVRVEANNYQRWRGTVGDSGTALVGLAPGIAYKLLAGRGGAWSSNPVTWQSNVAGGEVELMIERR